MFPPGKGEQPYNYWHQKLNDWIRDNVPGDIDGKTHNFRVTKATEIYKKTGKVKTASMYLGHTSIVQTEKYIKLPEEEMLDELDGLAKRAK